MANDDPQNVFLARIAAMEEATPTSGYNLVEVDEYEAPGEELHVHDHFDDRGEAIAAIKRLRQLHPDCVFHLYPGKDEELITDEELA